MQARFQQSQQRYQDQLLAQAEFSTRFARERRRIPGEDF